MERRDLLRATAAAVGLAGCVGNGTTEPSGTDAETPGGGDAMTGTDGDLSVTSPAFEDGEAIPTDHTCDGADQSPLLRIGGVPADAAALAVVVDDPDAPGAEPFVHWLLWNVPSDVGELPEGLPQEPAVDALDGAPQGTNDFGESGYRGPCPPDGDGPHTYRFTVHALDALLELEPGADRDALDAELATHGTASGRLTATYER